MTNDVTVDRPLPLLIDGQLVNGDSTLEVINPATGAVFATVARASQKQLDAAVSAAVRAFATWSLTDLDTRRTVLTDIADIVVAHAQELVALIVAEQGKPLGEARREVGGTAAFFRYVSAQTVPARTITDPDGRNVEILRRPLGPVAAVIPWNFPLLTIAFKLPFALLAGNSVVIKPAPTTPVATLRFAQLINEVVPAGVVNVITDDNDLGNALTGHPDIRKVSFTGSTATGRLVMSNAVATLKRLTLELGGNDYAIVLDDIDLSTVVPALFKAAFQNNGQVCLALKRLYVHDKVYDEVCAQLAELADAAVVGDGADEATELGPVQNERQFTKLRHLLETARSDGTVIAGGHVLDRPGYFLRPTIVRDIHDGSELVDEEQFGPLLPVVPFADLDDILASANATGFGLGASVWSSNPARARRVADRVDAGTVWINKHADIAPHIPFGGSKQSGVGVEFAEEGLLEFTQIKVISE